MDYPKEILLEVDIEDRDSLEIWLSANKKGSLKILNESNVPLKPKK